MMAIEPHPTGNTLDPSSITGFAPDRPVQAHWSTYSFVQLMLRNLPEGTTTLSIYNYFKKFGNISKIVIFDRRHDDRGNRAQLYFEPPPDTPLWERGPVRFEASNGFVRMVYVELAKSQPKNFQVESPVHRGFMYNERTELLASSIAFGVLTAPESMTVMKASEVPKENVKIVLNLRRREIRIHFPFVFSSASRTAVRMFRFTIALDEKFTIWKLPGNRYVLHLSNIPWFSKQLKEAIPQSHAPDGKQWTEEDTWARQTDIFEHKRQFDLINSSPVSLQKNLNIINIARWTTYMITLLDTEDNEQAETTFFNALKDFNVNIFDGTDFQIIQGDPRMDYQAWTLINGRPADRSALTFVEEMTYCHLPFPVRYHLEVSLSQGWISEYQVTTEFLSALSKTTEAQAKQMLVLVHSYQQRIWDPMKIFDDLRYHRPVKAQIVPEHCNEIYSATVTASSIIWNTTTVEITNRVIRKYKHYADRFLRVRFEDDAYRGQSRLHASSNNRMVLVFQRVKRTLLQGLKLGDRHYEFLAWGNSQLREHGAYFFARVGDLTAAKIRGEMGAFDQERVVAKRAARMGQCFSTTRPIHLQLPAVSTATTIKDIRHGKYIFSDGVGKISPLAAQIVREQLKIKGAVPSAFQFRLGGCKGVLVAWPDMTGINVQVRESQFKFDSRSGDLEIIRWSEFWQPFLNRQIILCLSDLGVPDEAFLKRQDEAIRALDVAMTDNKAAIKALRDNVDPNMMTLALSDIVDAGFRTSNEPFVMAILHLWRAWSLKYLKEKAKIPVSKGAFVLGCVDELNQLKGHFDGKTPHSLEEARNTTKQLPEIFIQITDPQTNQRRVIEGICVIARNPSLHRGDIRVVKAMDYRLLHHLCDVLVMPANGDRDLPSMCSGGDLDGDDYMVIWDPDLIPKVWNAEPFHYDPPAPKTATGDITTTDIINFFYDYLQNDFLGRIAYAHLGAADFSEDGIQNKDCLELVQLHSMAVDYPKTGVPARMARHLERVQWPHFMEKSGKSYHSRKVLGKLYDAVKRVSFTPNYDLPFDKRILNVSQPTKGILEGVRDLKQDYDNALQRIMAQHNITTEFEVWSTFVLNHSKASRDFKFHEEIGRLASGLKDQYFEALCELAGGKDFEHLAPVATAAYQYTSAMVQTAKHEAQKGARPQRSGGMPFISFPWVLKDTLCKLARDSDATVTTPGSIAIQKDGELVELAQNLEFDRKGRARIPLQDLNDSERGKIQTFSGHLPDPYQPQPVEENTNGITQAVARIDEDRIRNVDPVAASMDPLYMTAEQSRRMGFEADEVP